MYINTKYHGKINYDEEDIIYFYKGIPGFEGEQKFIILPLSDDYSLSTLQSIDNDKLAFVITNPFSFFQDYHVELDSFILDELGIESEQDVKVYSILTVQNPFENTTINLLGPIIINTKNQKAKQIIIYDTENQYQTKHKLFRSQLMKG